MSSAETSPENPQTPVTDDLSRAAKILNDLLSEQDGCVSSIALGRQLAASGMADPQEIVQQLKFYDFEHSAPLLPGLRYYHKGTSFYSESAFRATEKTTAAAAEQAEAAETTAVSSEGEEPTPRRAEYRQEEARLATYVRDALADIYASDSGPDAEYVFDVHRDRPGNELENVEIIAVHWRGDEVVELATVEVKLNFTARLVQQANNYRRFSDRVWIAVPVDTQLPHAAEQLRDADCLLFEHIVESGLGILACRRGRGRSYDVVPINWPRLMHPDRSERGAFLERHRTVFEEARVIAPQQKPLYPRFTG